MLQFISPSCVGIVCLRCGSITAIAADLSLTEASEMPCGNSRLTRGRPNRLDERVADDGEREGRVCAWCRRTLRARC